MEYKGGSYEDVDCYGKMHVLSGNVGNIQNGRSDSHGLIRTACLHVV